MTLKKIIKSLEEQAEDRESSVDLNDPEDIFRQDAQALREAVCLLRRLELPNDPLTLDQLREMEGEPVWCVEVSGNKRWGIVHVYGDETDEFECYTALYGRIHGWSYGTKDGDGWLAYRRKPEEGPT